MSGCASRQPRRLPARRRRRPRRAPPPASRRPAPPHRLGRRALALAVLPLPAPLARRRNARPAARTRSHRHAQHPGGAPRDPRGDPMTATIQTIDTPDGPSRSWPTTAASSSPRAGRPTVDAALDPHPPELRPTSAAEARRMPPPPPCYYARRPVGDRRGRGGPARRRCGCAAGRRCVASRPGIRRPTPSSPRRSGSPRAVRAAASLRHQRACAVRALPSRAANRRFLGGFAWGLDVKRACSPARPQRSASARRPPAPGRGSGPGFGVAFSELPGIRWRAVALAHSSVR